MISVSTCNVVIDTQKQNLILARVTGLITVTQASTLKSDILDAVESHHQPVVSARDIAEELEYSRQYIHRLLRQLHEDGYVQKVELGPSLGWYVKRDYIKYIEMRMEGANYEKMITVCSQCEEPLGYNRTVYGLLYRESDDRNWRVIDLICNRHSFEDTTSLIGKFSISNDEIAGAMRSGSSFAIVSGLDKYQNELNEVSLLQLYNKGIRERWM